MERPKGLDVVNGSPPRGEGCPPSGSESQVVVATTREAPVNKFASPVARANAEVIGLDVHQKVTACCRLDRRGRKLSDHTIGGDRESLEKFLREVVGRRQPHFALEACGGFGWVYDLLVERYGERPGTPGRRGGRQTRWPTTRSRPAPQAAAGLARRLGPQDAGPPLNWQRRRAPAGIRRSGTRSGLSPSKPSPPIGGTTSAARRRDPSGRAAAEIRPTGGSGRLSSPTAWCQGTQSVRAPQLTLVSRRTVNREVRRVYSLSEGRASEA